MDHDQSYRRTFKMITDPKVIPWLSSGRAAFEHDPKKPQIQKYILNKGIENEAMPERRIVIRATEIFVAAGCEIRCMDLRDLKARYEENVDEKGKGRRSDAAKEVGQNDWNYQVLDTPELDFEVHQLEVSPDGNFLAVTGEKRLGVCLLPTPGFARLKEVPRLRSKYKEVGSVYHNDGAARIVRAVWHPFGIEGASLIVATSDGIIRIYDFTMHLEHTFIQPDQTYDLLSLSGTQRRSSSFTPDLGDLEPASCCFGSGEVGWRPFTLYILTRGGDIYALCPIVPSRWVASSEYIKSLGLDISARMDALGKTENATIHERFILRQQTKWVNEVLEKSDTAGTGSIYSSIGKRKQDWFMRPEGVGSIPSLQGPFLLQPGPAETVEEYYGCDIMHIASDQISMLAVTYSNGNVDIFLEPEPIVAKWIAKKPRARQLERASDLPVVACFETIDIKIRFKGSSTSTNWPVFVENPLLTEAFYVATNEGIYAVDMSEWIQSLNRVLDEDESEDFIAKCLERAKGSKVTKVIDTENRISRPIVGCTAVQDSYLGYIILANSPSKLYAADLDIPLHFSRGVGEDLGGFDGITTNGAHRRLLEPPGYVPSILRPYYDPPEFLKQPPSIGYFLQDRLYKNPQIMRGPLFHNAQTLELLRQGRDQIKKEHEKLMSVAEAICNRARMQEIEYKRQLAKVDDLVGKIRKMKDLCLKERLDSALRRQQELNRRADQLIRELVRRGIGSGGTLGVEMAKASEKEKEWFEEVQKIERRVTGETRDSFKNRMETLNDMLGRIKVFLDEEANTVQNRGSEDRDDGVPKELRERRIEQLNQLLNEEGILIENTKSKTLRLEAKLEALGL